MSRFAHSLYARLALVLLLALGASFATMYFLFQGRLADTRDLHLARALAAQVNLVEAVLRAQPRPDLRGINDLILAREPPPPASDPHPEALASLRQALIEELGRDVELVPADPPGSGLWVSLRAAAGEPGWMLVPVHRPPPHPRRSDSILTALLVGFAVFFAGGLALLWQVQRPLKRLGEALAAVGKSRRPSRLPQLGDTSAPSCVRAGPPMTISRKRIASETASPAAGGNP